MAAVEIRRSAVDDILAHARAEAPRECCGLLVGTSTRVERITRAHNLRASPTRYLIDPADHFAAIRAARISGLQVVGAYHSHPTTAAVPSDADLGEATYPEYLYLIASLARAIGVRGYRLWGGRIEEVELTPVA